MKTRTIPPAYGSSLVPLEKNWESPPLRASSRGSSTIFRRRSSSPSAAFDSLAVGSPKEFLALGFRGVRQVGKGTFGRVLQIPREGKNVALLRALCAGLEHPIRYQRLPPPPTPLLLKIENKHPRDSAFWTDRTREALIHAHLCRSLSSTEFVPALYFAGAVQGAWITCMEGVPGKPLFKTELSSLLEFRLEHALRGLLFARVAHADLHPGNIMVTPDGAVKIIDFGISVVFPKTVASKVNAELLRSGSLIRAWKLTGLVQYVDKALRTRGYREYWANYRLVDTVKREMRRKMVKMVYP